MRKKQASMLDRISEDKILKLVLVGDLTYDVWLLPEGQYTIRGSRPLANALNPDGSTRRRRRPRGKWLMRNGTWANAFSETETVFNSREQALAKLCEVDPSLLLPLPQ